MRRRARQPCAQHLVAAPSSSGLFSLPPLVLMLRGSAWGWVGWLPTIRPIRAILPCARQARRRARRHTPSLSGPLASSRASRSRFTRVSAIKRMLCLSLAARNHRPCPSCRPESLPHRGLAPSSSRPLLGLSPPAEAPARPLDSLSLIPLTYSYRVLSPRPRTGLPSERFVVVSLSRLRLWQTARLAAARQILSVSSRHPYRHSFEHPRCASHSRFPPSPP